MGNPGWPDFHSRAGLALDRQLFDMPSLEGNHIQLIRNGDEAYPAMLEAIKEARSSIHFQTYLIRPDRIGKRFMDVLAEAAQKGVRIRFLYDRLGSSAAHLSGFFRPYKEIKNLDIADYEILHPLKRRFQINLRNHRKLLVIDGKIGFVGGINIHEENITLFRRDRIVHDYHFEIRGPLLYMNSSIVFYRTGISLQMRIQNFSFKKIIFQSKKYMEKIMPGSSDQDPVPIMRRFIIHFLPVSLWPDPALKCLRLILCLILLSSMH